MYMCVWGGGRERQNWLTSGMNREQVFHPDIWCSQTERPPRGQLNGGDCAATVSWCSWPSHQQVRPQSCWLHTSTQEEGGGRVCEMDTSFSSQLTSGCCTPTPTEGRRRAVVMGQNAEDRKVDWEMVLSWICCPESEKERESAAQGARAGAALQLSVRAWTLQAEGLRFLTSSRLGQGEETLKLSESLCGAMQMIGGPLVCLITSKLSTEPTCLESATALSPLI